MPLTIVKPNSTTKYVRLWRFDSLAAKWEKISQYPIPFETDDTRFHIAVIKAVEEGLVFFYNQESPGKHKPVSISDAVKAQILANPPLFLESPRIDFNRFWIERDRRIDNEASRPHKEMMQRFLKRYQSGEKLSNRVIEMLKKEGMIR